MNIPPLMLVSLLIVHAAAGAAEPARAISVREINDGVAITGALEKPLGAIVKIRGSFLPKPKEKNKNSPTEISVIEVNGMRCAPITIQFRPALTLELERRSGEVTLTGYESGGFTGTPDDVFTVVPSFQTTSFGFVTYFVALKEG